MFNKNSITYKYLKASIFIVIIPVLVANIILNQLYLTILLGSHSDRILKNIEHVSSEIDNEIKNDTLIASNIANDSEIIDIVNGWAKEPFKGQEDSIVKQMENRFKYLTNLDFVIFIFREKGMYCYGGKPLVSEDELRRKCSPSVESGKKISVLDTLESITEDSKGKYIRSIIVSPDKARDNNIETIYIGFNSRVFDNINNYLMFGDSCGILVTNSKGEVLVSGYNDSTRGIDREIVLSDKDLKKNNTSFTSTINGYKYFVTSLTMPHCGWKIAGMVNYKDLTEDSDNIKKFSYIFFGIMLILFVAFSFLFLRDILIPVDNLTKKMKIVEKGYLDTSIEIRGNDEINNLGKSFNNMVSEIRKLINERDTKEKEREKAEIEALQSQINPHFISNTLNSIRLMAMIAKADSIKNMTEAFMKLLNSTFNKKGIFNTIENEMDVLRSYIHIMKVRFGDKFDVEFQVDKSTRQLYVLKLVLQPILENAIYHGISDLDNKGLITIKSYRVSNDLVLEVRDNGKGMTEEELNELMSEGYRNTKGFNGIGLKNVDKRIKLNHGSKYGLKIESVFGEFTNVVILLPIISFEQGGGSDA
jgi:two-component system sensor histidine kinase YesM